MARPNTGIILRNGVISHHLAGGGTLLPLGPYGASPAVVRPGSPLTPPDGPGPPGVEAESALR
ncbi:hypothetical protein [Mycolicibacterium diernhoferi]|nr:hypothetical protein [Mycolicibacterium diernhoferi]QYL22503.1 hypothetical protein K0O62_26820 [Mycolicibacterium diernhoferi]